MPQKSNLYTTNSNLINKNIYLDGSAKTTNLNGKKNIPKILPPKKAPSKKKTLLKLFP